MARTLLLAWASPVDDDRDAEFNAWYEGTHIPQLRAAVGSISAVHRYRPAELPAEAAGQQPRHRYLTVYELDSDDVPAALAAMATAGFDMTTSMDLTENPPVLQWYRTTG